MSRPKTITLVAPNGAKTRTAFSKRYFVVGYWSEGDRHDANVLRRTDSPMSALAALRKYRSSAVVFAVSADGQLKNQLTRAEIEDRAQVEKNSKAFLTQQGRQGEARRLWY